jgi:hypothetical protein
LKKKTPANNDFTFLIVNFPFISSNIPAAPANAFYIAQLIRYSRACSQYSDYMDRVRLLTKKQLKQGSVAPRLKSSLQTSTVVLMEWLTVIKYQFLKW